MKILKLYILYLIIICVQSCNKTTGDTFIPCSEKMIEISIASSPSAGCGSNSGSITAIATGSSGFTFRINSSPFQSTGNFMNLPNGNYNITTRDSEGCEQTKRASVGSGIISGPKFTAVKNLFVLRCNRCHGGASPAASKDWSVDCVVLANKQVIYNRAVIIGDMPKAGPELAAEEKSIITDWMAAGGLVEN